MATMTPADATLQVRTFRRSPLSRARGHVGALWRRPLTQAIAKAVLTIYVTSTITFFLIRLMPGSLGSLRHRSQRAGRAAISRVPRQPRARRPRQLVPLAGHVSDVDRPRGAP